MTHAAASAPSVVATPNMTSALATLPAQDLRLVANMLSMPKQKVSALTTQEELAAAIEDDIRRPRLMTRDMSDLSDTVQYSDAETFYRIENALSSYNCHHGQRKLFFTMLEFMTMCTARFGAASCLVVYLGAAPGYNMRLIADLFPQASYLLVDPAPFDIRESHNVRIWRRIFNDQGVADVLHLNARLNKRHVLLVSDIRMNPAEEDIARDMMYQQRWGVKLGASAMMLKFRLPYPGTPATAALAEASEKIDDIRDAVELPTRKTRPANSFLYLDGSVYLQLYAPLRSSETRLVVFRPARARSSAKFHMRYYDFKKYEARMNAFNIVCRSLLTYVKPGCPESAQLGDHLLGYGADYESVAEYHLAYEYLKVRAHSYDQHHHVAAPRSSNDNPIYLKTNPNPNPNPNPNLNPNLTSKNSKAAEGGAGVDAVAWRLGPPAGPHASPRTAAAPTLTSYKSAMAHKPPADAYMQKYARAYNSAAGSAHSSTHSSTHSSMATPRFADVVKFLHQVNMQLVRHYSSRVSLMLCAIKTMATHTKKYNELDQDARYEQIKRVSQVVIARFKRQLAVVKSQKNLLTEEEKEQMISVVAHDVESIARELVPAPP